MNPFRNGTVIEVKVKKTAGVITPQQEDYGYLSNEPCRYCHQQGGVRFVIDDSPFGKCTSQVVNCTLCGSVWNVDGQRLN